jgi:hypothetical protein
VSRQRLTACLIVQDEEQRLPAALRSIAFCDEIVVVDGGSRDRTVELARAAGALVIENPWPGFAAQRNVALDAARGEWVLEIDADERISPELRSSIQALLEDPPANLDIAVFALRNRFLGAALGPSAKYPGYRARLFRRGAYRHDESRAVHEGLEVRERPLVLAGDLEHELAGTLCEALADTWRYARLESAHVAQPEGRLAYVNGMLARPAAKLAYRTIVEGGWRDGWRGLLKIALDVSSDVLVWARVLAGLGGSAADARPARAGEHFGQRRMGATKVVAVAAGGEDMRAAITRLLDLRARGVEVALVSGERPPEEGIPHHTLTRLGPLSLARALEAEMQIRPIDAVLPVGRRASLTLRLLPGRFRPQGADARTGERLG